MKKKIFLFIVILFIAYIALYIILVPKVIFINKSGYEIHIFGYYVDDLAKTNEEEPLKINLVSLKKDGEVSYNLGFFSNKGKLSSFWAYWTLPIKKNNIRIQNEITLPKEDFGWKNITFIIDENGDYYKEDDPQNKLPLITGTKITEE